MDRRAPAETIEDLVKEAVLDRQIHRRYNRVVDAAASSIRLVALLDCLWITDPERAADVAEKVKRL